MSETGPKGPTGPRASHEEREVMLAERFVSLADTLVDDFDVVDLLDELVHSVVDLLPVEHAGLLLLDEGQQPRLVASTSDSSRLLELFQLQSEEGGPCLECLRLGTPVTVDDLAEELQRWPAFSRRGVSLGFRTVHALPLRLRGVVIGALNLFGQHGRLDSADLRVGQSLADMATISILQQRTSDAAALEAQQLQQALTSRIAIEQAKGVLAESAGVEMDDAFAALRSYARAHNVRLSDLARGLAERRVSPDQVLPRRSRPRS